MRRGSILAEASLAQNIRIQARGQLHGEGGAGGAEVKIAVGLIASGLINQCIRVMGASSGQFYRRDLHIVKGRKPA